MTGPFFFKARGAITSPPPARIDHQGHANMRQKQTPQDAAERAAKRAHIQVRGFAPDLPATAWLELDEVLQYVPVSKRTWYRGIQSGMFPAPTKVRARSFWKARDIRRLLELGPKPARKRVPVPVPEPKLNA